MKFPMPKTLTEAIYPMLLINWIFGVGIIQYPIGRPRRIISSFWSLINFLTYLGFLRMANFAELHEFQESTIAANSYRLNAYCGAVFIAGSICLSQIRAKALNATFPKMNIVNDKLSILEIPNDFDFMYKAQIIQLGISFSLMFVMMVLDFKYIGFDFPNESSRIGFLLTSHYSLMFDFIVDCSFSGCLRYIHNRFQRLNKLLVELDSPGKIKTTIARKSNSQFPKYLSSLHEVHRNNSLAIRATEQLWLFYVIKEAIKIHRGLRKTAMELNKAFGVQVLFSIALSFGIITTVLYTTYIGVMESSWDSILSDWVLSLISLIWIIFYAMKIILTVHASENASYEAKLTGDLMIKFLDSPACDGDVRDQNFNKIISSSCIAEKDFTKSRSLLLESINKEKKIQIYIETVQSRTINIFTLELIQNPLTFTANGFFTLDYSLIRAMIGTVTTYLVIMIQMQNAH